MLSAEKLSLQEVLVLHNKFRYWLTVKFTVSNQAISVSLYLL